MLTDKQISILAQPLIDTYSKIEMELLLWIAEKFSAYSHVGGDLEWKLSQLAKLGALDEKALMIIAEMNNIPFREVFKAIEKAGIQSIDFKTFTKAFEEGATFVNVNNLHFYDVVRSVYGEVNGELRLIHQEIGNNTLRAYNQVLDQINLETVSGIYDYNTSLNRSLEKLSRKGITAQTYHRKKIDKEGNEILIPINYSIEAAARRTIVSAITRSANSHNDKVGEELGANHWITSQHLGARDRGEGHKNHESWQNIPYEKEEFKSVTGEGLVDGLGGANCRHTKRPFFPGISVVMPKLDTEENNRIFNLKQKQRNLEVNLRNAKKYLEMVKLTNDDEEIAKARNKVNKAQSKVKKWVDQNPELTRDYNREKIQESIEQPYEDVTKEWLDNVDTSKTTIIQTNDYFEKDGIRYDKSNSTLKSDISQDERSAANWLKHTFNENVEFVPRVENPEGISTPDFIFKNEHWDLKTLEKSSPQTIYRSINKKKRQSANFIVDITKSGHEVEDAIKHVRVLYGRKDTSFVSKVILKKDNDLIAVIQRKKGATSPVIRLDNTFVLKL